MTQDSSALLEQVRTVLREAWDPIGIRDVSDTEDEYEDYVPAVAKCVADGATAGEIAEALLKIERESLGLPGDPARARRVAERLHAVRD
ncbi:hypothetical protein [Methyloligella solikamskensis]|uniref:DUF1871 family protein n=1 Tax=Methyloligella solikamskensis TaxID=1177756 RepID=A0ABW3J822_9HYPH